MCDASICSVLDNALYDDDDDDDDDDHHHVRACVQYTVAHQHSHSITI